MRLWHESLIQHLPRQQLLGQHRECCALRGNGWGKKHATVNYVFQHPPGWLTMYHFKVMGEMALRGYWADPNWLDFKYRGKNCEPYSSTYIKIREECIPAMDRKNAGLCIYPEHNDEYLQECLDNLRSKGIEIPL